MTLREERTFTDEEVARAFEFILSPSEAREEAIAANAIPDYKGFEGATPSQLQVSPVKGPRSYDGDFLDLMTLVSANCAERAWALMGITPSEGIERRKGFLKRIAPILRRVPKVDAI
jgi:hypothetical protein